MITKYSNYIIMKEKYRGDWGLMFNNINDNNRDLLFNSEQFNATANVVKINAARSAFKNSEVNSNPFVDKTEISSDAMQLFQRDLDIKKFTQIATENPEDISYLGKMRELFDDGVVDPFEDDVFSELASNSKLWDDLEL